MKLDQPLRHLGSVPVEALRAALPPEDDAVWDRFSMRQRDFPVHRKTRSIAIAWTDGWLAGKLLTIEPDYAPTALTAAARDCAIQILRHFPGGKVVRLMLTELASGAAIPRHRDMGELLAQSHRCHIAIETRPEVVFMVDDVDYHLPEGELYEFDNMRPHGVSNPGPVRRVHLICNVLPA
jgi:aspartyl/asparaginyl beta-hydroxylase (cupin superfamily)